MTVCSRQTETGQQAEEVIVELDQARVGRLSRMDAMQAQAMSVGNRPAPATATGRD